MRGASLVRALHDLLGPTKVLGTHDELLKTSGFYSDLYRRQTLNTV